MGEEITFDTAGLFGPCEEHDDAECETCFPENGTDYRMGGLESRLGCKEGDGWFIIDDGTSDTVVEVMDGYVQTEEGNIVLGA